MRSVGARQGAFCFGYFYLGEQIKVARTSVRNRPVEQLVGNTGREFADPKRQTFLAAPDSFDIQRQRIRQKRRLITTLDLNGHRRTHQMTPVSPIIDRR